MTQYKQGKDASDEKARRFSGKPGQTPLTEPKKTILRDQPVRGGGRDN